MALDIRNKKGMSFYLERACLALYYSGGQPLKKYFFHSLFPTVRALNSIRQGDN